MTSPSSDKNDNQPKASGQPDVTTEPTPRPPVVNPWEGVGTPDYVSELTCSEGPSDAVLKFVED